MYNLICLWLQGKITAQGKLILHGPLLVGELANTQTRGREWQIFLFEQNIIFSEAVGKKTQFTNPAYIYKAHIQVSPILQSPWKNVVGNRKIKLDKLHLSLLLLGK